MDFKLIVWRQKDRRAKGKFVTYKVTDVSPDSSFFEMLDVLNQDIINDGGDPVAFDHDCREGICGTCSLYINGRPHGPLKAVTSCQVHMRYFKDGQTIVVEPWRAKPFPIVKDLIVDRSSFDRIIEAGGFVSVNTGAPQDANALPVPKENAEESFDAAACIGCGACVAACGNASAMLFVGAKITHLAKLPQGRVEAKERARNMIRKMDELGFGNCSNMYACEAECPKEISRSVIATMNREYYSAKLTEKRN